MRWLEELLATEDGDSQVRAGGYFICGFLAVLKADPAAAMPALRKAVATARQAEQRDLLPEALSMASVAENMAGNKASARRLLDEAQACATGLPGTMAVLQAQAISGFFEADLGTIRTAASAGVRLAREAGDLYSLEMMLLNLGSAALIAGDLDESKPLLAEALRTARQIDDRVALIYLLNSFGYHAALCGQARRAAQLLGAAETMRTEAGANLMPFHAPLLAKAEESASAALGQTRFQAGFEAGKRLDRDTALDLALGEPAHVAAATPGNASTAPLAKREADVARLVADGLTNRQIGARLFISERTVDSHVRSILKQLSREIFRDR